MKKIIGILITAFLFAISCNRINEVYVKNSKLIGKKCLIDNDTITIVGVLNHGHTFLLSNRLEIYEEDINLFLIKNK